MSGDDIVERLRDHLHKTPTGEARLPPQPAGLFAVGCARCEAAAEIVDLRIERDALLVRLDELVAEVMRLRAERNVIDGLHQPDVAPEYDPQCLACRCFWPCRTHLLLHPKGGRRER